jgi:hypothetical protein
VSYERIPVELQALPQWILWRYEETEGGKPTKVPYAVNGFAASTTDASTWSSFATVLGVLRASNGYYSGLGFVFTPFDPYTGLDLDEPKKPDGSPVPPDEYAKTIERQRKVLQQFSSYSERSPSGKGLHIIIKAKLPSGRRRSSIEMYSSGRFFTMTGDVYEDLPIAERQGIAEILYDQMGKDAPAYQYDGTEEEKHSDAEVVEMALNAVNGDKFKTLLDGDWQLLYPSQSEADLAFINIVAFYTQNKKQIRRIFRASPLGKRAKAKRDDYLGWMISKSFDQMLPPLDMDGLYNQVQEARAEAPQLEYANPHPQPEVSIPQPTAPAVEHVGIPLPRGLMGEIAQFIYNSSPLPVQEIALAGALGFMAGICGRSWNVNGAGLNLYTLMLAPTGRGKEAMNSGVSKLIASLSQIGTGGPTVPSAGHFVGPGEIASGQAIIKVLAKQPSFVSIIGEFGIRMASLASDKASSNDLQLKRTLLQLYSASGAGNVFNGMAYSDKEKNVASIQSPAFSILAESTPKTFYEVVDETLIADGLLPRFLVINYDGPRVDYNENAASYQPTFQLLDNLANLIVQAHTLNGLGTPQTVQFTDEAYAMQKDFGRYCTQKINESRSDTTVELWNRAHLKLIKFAALIAVGANPNGPVIIPDDINYAYRFIANDIDRIAARFESGEYGKDQETSHTRQQKDCYRMMMDHIQRSHNELTKYGVTKDAYELGLISHSYISRRLLNMASFKKDKQGATVALKRTVAELIAMGVIKQVAPKSVENVLKSSGAHYQIVNNHWL